jgi:hypothetical protein
MIKFRHKKRAEIFGAFSFLLALLGINLEVHNKFFAAFKTRNRARGRLGAILFGVQFKVGIWIKTAESVISGIVRDVAAHRIGPRILEEYNRTRYRRVRFIGDNSMDAAEL